MHGSCLYIIRDHVPNTLGFKSGKRRKFSSTTFVSLSKTVPLMDSLYWCNENNMQFSSDVQYNAYNIIPQI